VGCFAAVGSYGDWLKKDLGEAIDALDLDPLQVKYMKSRWLDQVTWMEGKAKGSQWRYYALRLVTIVGGVVVPALVSLNITRDDLHTTVEILTFSVSLLVALSAAVEAFFRYGERWRHYRQTVEALKGEGWTFIELAGPYGSFAEHQGAFRSFAERIEALVQQDVERYVTRVVEEKKEDKRENGA
jgi:Protein of unknown function (DUF4231)